MDDFEVYIQSNKSEFNEPSLDKNLLWDKIEQQLEDSEAKFITIPQTWLAIAALCLLFIGLGFLSIQFRSFSSLADKQKLSPEMVEIKAHYNHLIHLKLNEIEETENINTQEKAAFLLAIEELDIEANNLQHELKQPINSTIVIEAIIQNYQQQIWLLERLQHRVEKLKTKNHEQGIII